MSADWALDDEGEEDFESGVMGIRPKHVWVIHTSIPRGGPRPDRMQAWDDRQRSLPEEKRSEFYWPSVNQLYRSRSGARERADLLRWYGAEADIIRFRLVEDTPKAKS